MTNLVFRNDEFLKKGNLVIGHVYLYKDGRLVVYLGKSKLDKFVFYILANVLYTSIDWHTLTIAHYNTQIEHLISLSETLMKNKCDTDCIIELKGMPQLYCEFPFVSYDKELNRWWTKNVVYHKGKLPALVDLSNENKSKGLFVSAKDLVPGELYYTGSLWRSLYLYLGRDSQKNFCWYFVGSTYELLRNDFNAFRINMDRTKSNKHCKRLADAPNDPDAMLYDDAQKLLSMNYHADLYGLDLG